MHPPSQADLLHPLTSLEWTFTKHISKEVGLLDHDALQAVWLNGKLYIVITSYPGDLILCCDSDMQLLTTMRSPTHESALTTYQGRLVMVGGREVATGDTNKLWSLQDDGTWAEDLPPMPTRRRSATAVSTGHHLLVAGGLGEDGVKSAVEVFDGKRWSTTKPLPEGDYGMKSALLNGEWYLMGGLWPGRSVFSASVAALLATAGTNVRTHSVWKRLPVAPLEKSSPASFGGLLLAIGGLGEYNFLCHCTQQALNSALDCGVQWHLSGLRMSITLQVAVPVMLSMPSFLTPCHGCTWQTCQSPCSQPPPLSSLPVIWLW